MHDINLMISRDIERERLLEADRWRLAKQVNRAANPTIAGRLRQLLVGVVGQPASAPASTLASDSPGCGS